MSRMAESHFRRKREAPLFEGKHVTIQGPYPEMSPAAAYAPRTVGAGIYRIAAR